MRELLELVDELTEKGDHRGSLLYDLISRSAERSTSPESYIETPVGEIQASQSGDDKELYIDLFTPSGEHFPIACVTVEVTPNGEMDVVSKLFVQENEEKFSKFSHQFNSRIRAALKEELESLLDELTDINVEEHAETYCNRFFSTNMDATGIVIKEGLHTVAQKLLDGEYMN